MKFVMGQHVMPHIEQLIHEAQESILLISPFYWPGSRIKAGIQEALQRDIDTWMVTREKQWELLAGLEQLGLTRLTLHRLHAKIYASERAVFVSSMNLDRHAGSGSWDVGSLYTREDDGFDQIMTRVGELWRFIDSEARLRNRHPGRVPQLLHPYIGDALPALKRIHAQQATLEPGTRVGWDTIKRGAALSLTGTVEEVFHVRTKVDWDQSTAPKGNPLIEELYLL